MPYRYDRDLENALQLQHELETRGAPAATPAEACREYAANCGAQFPERPWILTDFDSWEPNPYYRGPPARHPEDDQEGPPAEAAPPSPPLPALDFPF